MSITSALSNALSGLNAASREADLISNNVANALTPGYTRKTLEVSSVAVEGRGAGVAVGGVRSAQDPVTTASRVRSDAQVGAEAARSAALGQISDLVGLPGEGTALAERAAAFERALQSAASEPSSRSALRNVVSAGNQLVDTFSALSTETQRVRMDTDAQIAAQVDLVNQNLRSIELLNQEIRMRGYSGGDTSALIDQRQSLVDRISSVLPIRSVPRDGGEIALFTIRGATLIDGPASELGFTGTPIITQDMTLASGALSGLTLNDRPVDMGTVDGNAALDGGSLGSLFALRDRDLPAIAQQLDTLAADLIGRFQDPAIDPTLAAGDAGLFTDAGAAFAVANQEGLAARLSLSSAVDPSQGGEVWRLRDGLGAAVQGPEGDGALLNTLFTAAISTRAPAGVPYSAGSIAELAGSFMIDVADQRAEAEQELTFQTALNVSLRDAESVAVGVNTDTEMQRLLLVEQSYSANARVIQTVDQLIRRLLEI